MYTYNTASRKEEKTYYFQVRVISTPHHYYCSTNNGQGLNSDTITHYDHMPHMCISTSAWSKVHVNTSGERGERSNSWLSGWVGG